MTFYARKRSTGMTMRLGVLVPESTLANANTLGDVMLYGDTSLRRLALPSTADPDKVADRADRAAQAAAERAVATGRGYGVPVKAYRSRNGRQWPGYSPVGIGPFDGDTGAAPRDRMGRKS